MIFSFDFSGTLDAHPDALKAIIRGLSGRGVTVVMVTGAIHENGQPVELHRQPRERFQQELKQEGIEMAIHYCYPDHEKGKSKLSVCRELKVAMHFDNDQKVAQDMRAAGIPVALTGMIV